MVTGSPALKLQAFSTSPLAFAIIGLYVAIWLILDRAGFGWQSVATVGTWFMTLIIQRAEHRDTLAIHAKLDELLRARHQARNELTHIEEQEPEEIAQHRASDGKVVP
jgi:low affinity Fe/Cu permease